MENIEKIENNNNIENKAFFNSNLNNKKILNKKNSEEGKDTQFYLITLEDNNGEHQQIRIIKIFKVNCKYNYLLSYIL